ncbi:MAG: S-layer family protein [Leptolyngbyaceae cyanobacterium CSU_1_3]|nr:S-layer family protein [Leptolyngbyaceae cyanobacterium CSU_1_3]
MQINAQSIFGIQFRPELTNESDITASSRSGAQGVVSINTPDVDPSRGLVALPIELTDPSNQIAQTCATNQSQTASRFVATGRGGMPLGPDGLSLDGTITRLATIPDQSAIIPPVRLATSAPLVEMPVEAQNAVKLPNGKIRLVARSFPAVASPIANCETLQSVERSEGRP